MYDIDVIFSHLDRDSSGALSFYELFIAIVDPKIFLDTENIIKAFKGFDLDGGGSISIDEMQQFLSPHQKLPDYIWRMVLGLRHEDSLNVEVTLNDFREFIKRLFELPKI